MGRHLLGKGYRLEHPKKGNNSESINGHPALALVGLCDHNPTGPADLERRPKARPRAFSALERPQKSGAPTARRQLASRCLDDEGSFAPPEDVSSGDQS